MENKTRILFVCLGNIVRSPLAENLFAHLAEQAGMGGRYQVDSAGTGGWHAGEQPDVRMRQVAAGRGFDYDGSARQFTPADFDRFDWIIAMDASNRMNLAALARTEADVDKIRMMRAFDPAGSSDDPVPDPYYGGIDGFERVYDIVERSCRGLLEALERSSLSGDGG
ncbi:MAG TPA: low molecular weight protein-tyrosine-phosphatase [Anaerolineales bacterium]|nr:low molecular weight protein-tyrosine-phosphatase [Anaerolineales bacterium]